VISNKAYNIARSDAVIMAITSQLHLPSGWGEVQIGQWQAANLLKPSAIKPVFATLEQSLILRRLGMLHLSDQIRVASGNCCHSGLADTGMEQEQIDNHPRFSNTSEWKNRREPLHVR
jgi:mRNA interferase MazF